MPVQAEAEQKALEYVDGAASDAAAAEEGGSGGVEPGAEGVQQQGSGLGDMSGAIRCAPELLHACSVSADCP